MDPVHNLAIAFKKDLRFKKEMQEDVLGGCGQLAWSRVADLELHSWFWICTQHSDA